MADPGQYGPTEVSIGARTSPLSAYVLRSVSGAAVVLTGFFTDNSGQQVTGLQTFSITAAISITSLYAGTGANLSTSPLPQNYFGFEGEILSGNLWYGKGGKDDGTFSTANPDMTPAAGYPQIAAGNPIQISRIS